MTIMTMPMDDPARGRFVYTEATIKREARCLAKGQGGTLRGWALSVTDQGVALWVELLRRSDGAVVATSESL